MKTNLKKILTASTSISLLALSASMITSCSISTHTDPNTIQKEFEKESWNDLIDLADDGLDSLCSEFNCQPSDFVGLEKTIEPTLVSNANFRYKVRVVGVGEDELYNQGSTPEGSTAFASLTFQFETVLSYGDGNAIYLKFDNDGDGWHTSDVRQDLLDMVEEQMYDISLRAKRVRKTSSVRLDGMFTDDYSETFFLPSLADVFSQDALWNLENSSFNELFYSPSSTKQTLTSEGRQYSYYQNTIGNKSIDASLPELALQDANGNYVPYMFRSVGVFYDAIEETYDNEVFYYDNLLGSLLYDVPTEWYALAPCFCLGKTLKHVTFENDSWENVCDYANQGINKLCQVYGLRPQDFVGKIKKLDITDPDTGEVVTHKVKVVGVTEDEIYDTTVQAQKRATLTFQFDNVISNAEGVINITFCETPLMGGYCDSDVRMVLNLLPLSFPEVVYNNIQEVSKTSADTCVSNTANVYPEFVFLPSLADVFSEAALLDLGWINMIEGVYYQPDALLSEGHQYSYYQRVMGSKTLYTDVVALLKVDIQSTVCSTMFRSTLSDLSDGPNYWCADDLTGTLSNYEQNFTFATLGCAPCFCIGESDPVITFENDSWENVVYYANLGLYELASHYNMAPTDFVGKTRRIWLNQGGELLPYVVRVVDVAKDQYYDGEENETATLTFQFDTLISGDGGVATPFLFHDPDQTIQDWSTSYIRGWLNNLEEGFIPSLPDVVKENLVARSTHYISNETYNVEETSDYIFLPAIAEVLSYRSIQYYAWECWDIDDYDLLCGEGSQFAYYRRAMNTLLEEMEPRNPNAVPDLQRLDINKYSYPYWLRTPYLTDGASFIYDSLTARICPNQADVAAICPCFDIGYTLNVGSVYESSWDSQTWLSNKYKPAPAYPTEFTMSMDMSFVVATMLYVELSFIMSDYQFASMIANDIMFDNIYRSEYSPASPYTTEATIDVVDVNWSQENSLIRISYAYLINRYDDQHKLVDTLSLAVLNIPLLPQTKSLYGETKTYLSLTPYWLSVGATDELFQEYWMNDYTWAIAGYYNDPSNSFEIYGGMEGLEENYPEWCRWSGTLWPYLCVTPYLFINSDITFFE